MDKGGIRKYIYEKRKNLNLEEVISKSEKIRDFLFSLEQFKKAEAVLFYASFDNEVNTRIMISSLLKEKLKKVVLPKTKGELLEAYEIKDLDDIISGRYGIPEPSGKERYCGVIDLIIVPGIAFDKRGYRIGFGRGYYDRFLAGEKADKIGLAFQFQVLDFIPNKKHDIPVNNIITENGIIHCQADY